MPATAAGYPSTYYTATAPLPPARAPLEGPYRCDVCVVGGGLAGLSAALELAGRGYRVCLLEEHVLGWGASGRSGGQALPGIAVPQRQLERLVGPADARQIWNLTLEGLALLKTRMTRHAIDCDFTPGTMEVAIRPRQWRDLQRRQAWLQDHYDYRATQLLPPAELTAILGSRRYCGALYDPGSGHLHPLRYVLGLAAAAAAAGVVIHEGNRALDYQPQPGTDRLRVRCARGAVDCRQLILAGNTGLGAVAPVLERSIAPVRTYMIATEPLGAQRAAALIANHAAVADTNWVLNYFRLSADHRLLFGGGISYCRLDGGDAAGHTRRRMLRVFPQLATARIEFAWAGDLDITRNRAPHFGRLAPNVWFLQGFCGHGIVLTGIAGSLVAQAIATTAERFDVFARIPHRDFPGGRALRRPILALAMLWYRLLDAL